MLNGLLSWVALRNPVSALRASLVNGLEHDEVVELMRKITTTDLGVEDAWQQATLLASEACYVPVCETSRFHICMFLLKPNAKIPLHDHPGMTVLSRVMTGSLRVVSYDKDGRHEAELQEGASAELFPDVRNIHEFAANDAGPERADLKYVHESINTSIFNVALVASQGDFEAGPPAKVDLLRARLATGLTDFFFKAEYGWYSYQTGGSPGEGPLDGRDLVDRGFNFTHAVYHGYVARL